MRGGLKLLYLLIGAYIAYSHGYFEHVGNLADVVSAILAVILWPLVLFGVHLNLNF
ncbi:MAG: hypothetical protein QOG62_1265 [Thermoleophilaceae bacterium]|jgi:hypothetical protein|nr:hypothetical protein [Thermoleophilaceae bacterium]